MFYDNMPDYSKSIIYTIRTRDGLYVGSTTNFTNRKHQHKYCILSTSLKNNLKLYQTIRDNDGEWIMKPYKEFPCENKTQLNIEEERIRLELKADLNGIKCFTQFRCIKDLKKTEQVKLVYRKKMSYNLIGNKREKMTETS